MGEKKLNTYGFDLEKVIADAKENGNTAFAELAEKQIADWVKAFDNVQAVYDAIAQKHTSTEGENIWNIDAEYLKTMLK